MATSKLTREEAAKKKGPPAAVDQHPRAERLARSNVGRLSNINFKLVSSVQWLQKGKSRLLEEDASEDHVP